jgi:Lsr2.
MIVARKVQVHLLDDIDGGKADETLKFALDGTNYEIDLSTKHADKLRKSVDKFVQSARRVGRGPVATAGRGGDRPFGALRPGAEPGDPGLGQAPGNRAERARPHSAHIIEQYEAEAGR